MGKNRIKVGFITTIDTNIGDDFIRQGIINLLSHFEDVDFRYTLINKHDPDSSLKNRWIKKILDRIPPIKGKGILNKFFYDFLYARDSVFKDQDLIIQSGAPVLWPNCQQNEWAKPLWYSTVGKLSSIPTINLAAGSCYPWENNGEFHDEAEKIYANDIGGFCEITTTRDELAHKLFNDAGVENIFISCTAFFVDSELINIEKPEYVLLNIMEGGGHFDWGQQINAKSWEKSVKEIVSSLSETEVVKFICHNQKEYEYALNFCDKNDVFFPKSVVDYLAIIKKAKIGINNRMHASVAMASVGVPSISICTDTRLLMLKTLNQSYYYIKDVTSEEIIHDANEKLKNREKLRQQLFHLKEDKMNQYKKILNNIIYKINDN